MLSRNKIVLNPRFESEGRESFTAFPPHSSEIVYPQQRLHREEPNFSIDFTSSGDEDNSVTEKSPKSNLYVHCNDKNNDNTFAHGREHSYSPIIIDDDVIGAGDVNKPDQSGYDDVSKTSDKSIILSSSSTDNGNLDARASPTPSATSILSNHSMLSNITYRVSRCKGLKLHTSFNHHFGIKKTIKSDEVELEIEDTGEISKSIGNKSSLFAKGSPTFTDKDDMNHSASSISSTDASVGERRSMKPAKTSKFAKYFGKSSKSVTSKSRTFAKGTATCKNNGDMKISPSSISITDTSFGDRKSTKAAMTSTFSKRSQTEIEFLQQYSRICSQYDSPSRMISPTFILEHGSGLSYSPSCNSVAETEIWNNLTNRFAGGEKYRMGSFDDSIEANSLCDSGVKVTPKNFNRNVPKSLKSTTLFMDTEMKPDASTSNSNKDTTDSQNICPKVHEVELLYIQDSGTSRSKVMVDGVHYCAKYSYAKQSGAKDTMGKTSFSTSNDSSSHSKNEQISHKNEAVKENGVVGEAVWGARSELAKSCPVKEDKTTITVSSQTLDTTAEESCFSSSSSSSASSSRSSVSGVSNCSQGILKPPRIVKSNYDPFGIKTDFSTLSQRHVHFSNLNEIEKKNTFHKLMKAPISSAGTTGSSDSDSTSSLVFLMQYMGCGSFEDF